AVALQKAASELIDKIDHDMPQVKAELVASKDWRARYRLDGHDPLPALERALADPSRLVRLEALKVIAALEGATPLLHAVLDRVHDESPDVRAQALEILVSHRVELRADDQEIKVTMDELRTGG